LQNANQKYKFYIQLQIENEKPFFERKENKLGLSCVKLSASWGELNPYIKNLISSSNYKQLSSSSIHQSFISQKL
jgi:hypothetical protein